MLTGKTAIITGASRGIGAAIAEKFAALGANIAVIYAGNESAAQAVCNKCRQDFSIRAEAYRCDVADFQAAKETVAQIKKDFGAAHILVNNAGITRDGLLPRMSEEQFDSVISVNLKSVFNMMRHASGLMIRQRSGRIINISSVVGVYGNAGQANYAASKAGIIGMTKTAAKELGKRGITVNAIAPGFIRSSMTDALPEPVKETMLGAIALGRFGEPGDVAGAVAFLASDEAAYISGQVLEIDGCISM